MKKAQKPKPIKTGTMVTIYVDKRGKTLVEEQPSDWRTVRPPKRKRGKRAA